MEIQNKQEIIAALREKINAFINYITQLNKEEFEATPNGKRLRNSSLAMPAAVTGCVS